MALHVSQPRNAASALTADRENAFGLQQSCQSWREKIRKVIIALGEYIQLELFRSWD